MLSQAPEVLHPGLQSTHPGLFDEMTMAQRTMADSLADVWALGIMLYACVVCELPFGAPASLGRPLPPGLTTASLGQHTPEYAVIITNPVSHRHRG